MGKLIRFLFLLESPVSRAVYLKAGMALMALKFAGEWLAAWYLSSISLSPAQFLLPIMSLKAEIFEKGPSALLLLFVLWSLPFMWVGLGMSVRRAVDAGFSPWFALLFLAPFVNYLVILILATMPRNPHAISFHQFLPEEEAVKISKIRVGFEAVVLSTLIGVGVVALSSFTNPSYGTAVFLGLPSLIGALAAYQWNVKSRAFVTIESVQMAFIAVLCAGLGFLLFAIEGVICILMAAPFAIVGAIIGGLIGDFIARRTLQTSVLMGVPVLVATLVGVSAIEGAVQSSSTGRKVSTSIEIQASRQEVWNHLVEFAEISEPSEFLFRAGIAYPLRARIEGRGVGAIRYCEFSTGPFVEPITVWHEPEHLAFDVSEQPATMEEMTPYRHVAPLHLKQAFRSSGGEFRLEEAGRGTTLLTGNTWYRLEIAPQFYWALWSDFIVHQIHLRVLTQIKRGAEESAY